MYSHWFTNPKSTVALCYNHTAIQICHTYCMRCGKTEKLTYNWVHNFNRFASPYHHLLWKLKDLIAKANIVAKNTQKPATIIAVTHKKSCLYPNATLSTCLIAIQLPSDSFTDLSSLPYCEVRRPYRLHATGFAQ